MAKFDMNAMLKQAQQMQAQMMEAQEQAKQEVVEASAGGGMVTVKANGGGEIVEIRIDPKAIDPDDPEMLADIVHGGSQRGTPLGCATWSSRRSEGPDARPRFARASPVSALRADALAQAGWSAWRRQRCTARRCHRGRDRLADDASRPTS